MKSWVILSVLLAIICFALQVYAQQAPTPPRTLAQIQTEFTQWQGVFTKGEQDYNTGMRIVERAMANMEQAKAKLQALVEEAKQIQAQAKPKPAPIGPVDPDCPDGTGNCEEAPVK